MRSRPSLRGVAFVVVVVLLALVPTRLSSSWNLELAFACIYAVVGLSLKLVVGSLGQVSLGHQALVAIGGFAAADAVSSLHFPLVAAIAAGGVAGAFVACLLGIVALRLRGLHLALITLIFAVAAQNYLFQTTWFSGGALGVSLFRAPWLQSNYHMYLVALAVLVVAMIFERRLTSTKLGRGADALRQDERVAEVYGINALFYKVMLFTLSGLLAGLAGALWLVWEQVINGGDFGYQIGLLFLLMVVLGGVRHQVGVVVTSASFGVFSFVLSQIHPVVSLVGSTRLALFLPALTGPLVTLLLIKNARAEARLRAGSSVASSGTDGAEFSVRGLARIAPETFFEKSRAQSAAVLSVDHLGIRFGGLRALHEVSLRVDPGEIVGIVGPNGAGKTTCFNCISGHQRKWSGNISYGGNVLNGQPASRRATLGIARTFQGIGLLKESTVIENMMVARHRAIGYSAIGGVVGSPRSIVAERELHAFCRDLLRRADIGHLERVRVGTLSYGLMRMVEIMCVSLTEPTLLMLDEPSSGMSPDEASALTGWLEALHATTGISLLVIEHHVPMVARLCSRVYVLSLGEVIAEGTPAEIQGDPAVVSAFLGEPMK